MSEPGQRNGHADFVLQSRADGGKELPINIGTSIIRINYAKSNKKKRGSKFLFASQTDFP